MKMSVSSQQRPKAAPQPGDILVAIHDFDARSADELTLRKTDQIELVEMDEGFGDGWYLGKHLGQGTMGLFPGVYTAKLPPHFSPVGATAVRSPQLSPNLAAYTAPTPESVKPATPTSPTMDSSTHRTVTSSPHQHTGLPLRSSVPPSQTTHVHRSIGQALSRRGNGEESPVMNETLSVINEHITDLSTPRQSLAPPDHLAEDTESEYSSHLDRSPYIAGPETDSEENSQLTEADVRSWDAKETAEYLRGLGIDPKHCDIFEEQEITGDVLLDMDQSFIHMKEFDFGLMGRRLKTWHKIRDFQNQLRGGKDSRKSSLKNNGSSEDVTRSQVRGTTLLPRIPSLMEEPGLSIRPSQHTHPYVHVQSTSPVMEHPKSPSSFARSQLRGSTPPSPWRASLATDSPTRPSASSIRDVHHSRRHSSVEYAKPGVQEPPTAHKKNASFDRDWSMSNATTANTSGSAPSLKLNISNQPPSIDLSVDDGENSTAELDRGYFSGNELDNRKARNLLRKRGGAESAGHSRQSSAMDDSSRIGLGMKRHTRLSSVDSIRERALVAISPAAKAYHSRSYKGRFRSASARNLTPIRSPIPQSPTVTNLEEDSLSALSSPKLVNGSTSPLVANPATLTSSSKARKLLGIRAASEAVTGNEKDAAASSTNIISDTLKESPVASPSGSQTPSVTSRSFDMDQTDTSSKGTTEQLGPLLHTKTPVRTNPKTKRQTSAYTKGLLQISPTEARKTCDYSGWMKKRSSGIVAQWKPRLFVLRGRRLSYYYSETDTEEKGIIDISGHKVLGTAADPITSLSTVMTGKSTPSNKSAATSSETSPNVARGSPSGAPFYFKLVPPKAGSSRAVQFTKPTVHVFQVDNITEGRKWMAEILKATIEHDLTSFETTNRQKTISLAKARARKERPPALKGTEDQDEMGKLAELPEQRTPQQEKGEQETGLNIQGLEFNDSDMNLQLGTGSADVNTRVFQDDAERETKDVTTSGKETPF
ncbi:SAM domain family protein [Cladophialophora carrionii]|uniref:SAM domain family protein n=1 Tax=Cladophialophora carrionii TaxID=86049 RepID=A0A1C1CFY9_9EURO|nr:SAM domain family protein [Cladophialophora carrionii]